MRKLHLVRNPHNLYQPHHLTQIYPVRVINLISQHMSTLALFYFLILQLQMVPHFDPWFLTYMPVVPVTISVSGKEEQTHSKEGS